MLTNMIIEILGVGGYNEPDIIKIVHAIFCDVLSN